MKAVDSDSALNLRTQEKKKKRIGKGNYVDNYKRQHNSTCSLDGFKEAIA